MSLLSAHDLLDAFRARRLSPVEVVEALAARIDALDPGLGAFTATCLERAREEASACERSYLRGEEERPLAGGPFAVKDLFDTDGVRSAYGSPMFSEHVPRADAVVVRRLREAGGILIGKTQTHEFAWGITSVNERMGTSRNPWAPERISGGSSGGSGVALAAHMTPLAVGSDTGGSIRAPSAFCGTVGLKPTFGRLDTGGVWPLAPSLDHPGAMARTPDDVALLLRVMDRPRPQPPPAQWPGLAGIRLAVGPQLDLVPLAPAVRAAFDSAAAAAEGLGAHVVEARLDGAELAYPSFGVIQRAEALATHTAAGLWPARRAEYGADVLGRLEAGERVTLDDYREATLVRQRLAAAAGDLFRDVQLLLTPVSAVSPPLIEQTGSVSHAGREQDVRELIMPFTVLQDLLGLPTCTLRAGFDELGLPVGVQLTGPPWSEPAVLAAAAELFAATAAVQESWPL